MATGNGNLTGVILAEGDPHKITGGLVKSLAIVDNKPLVLQQIEQMRTICDEVMVVTNAPRLFLPIVDTDVRVLTDYYAHPGPLAGMHAAFKLSKNRDIWVANGTLLKLSPGAALLMAQCKRQDVCDAVMPRIGGELQPYHAIYDKALADVLASLLHAGAGLPELIEMMDWREVQEAVFQAAGISADFVEEIKLGTDPGKAIG